MVTEVMKAVIKTEERCDDDTNNYVRNKSLGDEGCDDSSKGWMMVLIIMIDDG